MGNMNNATSGAMQGAQMGGSVGGGWGAAIGAVIGAVVGYNTADPVQEALKAQKKYNDLVITNAATDLFNTQRNHQLERMRTARALQAYQAQGKTSISQVRAGMGAADLIGGSAVALAQAIDSQTTQALAGVELNQQVLHGNYLTSIAQIANRGDNQLQRTIKESYLHNNFSIQSAMEQGKGMMGGMGGGGGGGMFSNANSGGSGGILGSGSGGGYSGTMDYGSMSSVSNVNWGGGGSLGIS